MKARFALFLLFAILSLKLSVVFAQENIFTVWQPDYQKSPYTGMTRQHWIQAGEYLLKGAFNYIHTLDDQMYFPKQLDKTYPKYGRNSSSKAGRSGTDSICSCSSFER